MKPRTTILLASAAIVIGVAAQFVYAFFVSPNAPTKDSLLVLPLAVLALGIVVGLLRGNRLAWQSGRILAMVAGALQSVFGVLAITSQQGGEDSTQGIWMLASGLLFAVGAALLHSRAAREHVQLICPKCQVATSRPANMSFSEARCRNPECNHKW